MQNSPRPDTQTARFCCDLLAHTYDVHARWNKKRPRPKKDHFPCPLTAADVGLARLQPMIWGKSLGTRRTPGPHGTTKSVWEVSPLVLAGPAADGTLYVAFRGTRGNAQWTTNSRFPSRAWKTGGQAFGKVHDGFADLFDYIAPDFFACFDALLAGSAIPQPKIVFTGHSLGGAVATLAHAAAQLRLKELGRAAHLQTLTFGGPRVGNPAFAAEVLALDAPIWRYVNTEDLVPKLPWESTFGWKFEHVGHEIAFTQPANAHGIPTYRAAC